MATAAFLGDLYAPALRGELETYGTDQLDWVFGLNPFDASMQMRKGRNTLHARIAQRAQRGVQRDHERLRRRATQLPPPHDQYPAYDWRWSEQRLPHGAWLVQSLAAQQAALRKRMRKLPGRVGLAHRVRPCQGPDEYAAAALVTSTMPEHGGFFP